MDLFEFFKFILTAIITSIPSLILVRKYKADARKTTAESLQIDSDTLNEQKRVVMEAKKTEVEVAERLIKSAGELIENYKDMINSFTIKLGVQEEKLNSISSALQAEIRKREKLERTLKEFIVGIKRLLAQLRENKITPVWEPKIDIDVVED